MNSNIRQKGACLLLGQFGKESNVYKLKKKIKRVRVSPMALFAIPLCIKKNHLSYRTQNEQKGTQGTYILLKDNVMPQQNLIQGSGKTKSNLVDCMIAVNFKGEPLQELENQVQKVHKILNSNCIFNTDVHCAYNLSS